MDNQKLKLKLRGKTIVFIDWANVYGWKKSLKKEIDLLELFQYLKDYKEIVDIRLYFGKNTHIKSAEFLQKAEKIGYTVITKPVKHILVTEIEKQKIYRRKCDFDMEISIDVHRLLGEGVESFIFFTGDGDFKPLYEMLINLDKQVVVVYMYGHLGREIFDMKKGIYKIAVTSLLK